MYNLAESASCRILANVFPILRQLTSVPFASPVHRRFPLLQFSNLFRDRLIGRTSAFGAEYPGSSPGPGTNLPIHITQSSEPASKMPTDHSVRDGRLSYVTLINRVNFE